MVSSKITRMVSLPKGKFLSLAYHDIFDYPLAREDLEKWEVRGGKVDIEVGSENDWLVEKTGEFYHLPGRRDVVLLRRPRAKSSGNKIKIAWFVAGIIAKIPTVLFVGLTGSLAMKNSEEGSDIDFLIITKKNTLWITRALVSAILVLGGIKRRSPEIGGAKDKLCLNMWLDEDNLMVPKEKRNIYMAHEVLQVVPLVNRDQMFEKFLRDNEWACEYWRLVRNTQNETQYIMKDNFLLGVTCYLLRLSEPIAYRLQLWYMQKHRTRETIEPGHAFFHPVDWSTYVTGEFENRVKQRVEARVDEPSLLASQGHSL